MQATDKLQLIRWLRRAALSAVLAVTTLAALAGCKSVDLKGDGFHDDMARWGEKQRPPDQPQEGNSEMLGVSAKSQQVERNLGVR